jgi:hypothetical protein
MAYFTGRPGDNRVQIPGSPTFHLNGVDGDSTLTDTRWIARDRFMDDGRVWPSGYPELSVDVEVDEEKEGDSEYWFESAFDDESAAETCLEDEVPSEVA